MKKELIHKEFLKPRLAQPSYSKCAGILEDKFSYKVSIRTLNRWQYRFANCEGWNLIDSSKTPKRIHSKLTPEKTQCIIALRERTGWGAQRLKEELSHLGLDKNSSYYTKRLFLEN